MQDDEHRPGEAAEAVGRFIADGTGGGQEAPKQAKSAKVGAGGTAVARAAKP